MRNIPFILVLGACSLFVGCGLSSIGEGVGNALASGILNAFNGDPVRDIEGYVSDGGVITQGDVLRVGDDGPGTSLRSTFGFDLPASNFGHASLRLHIDHLEGQPFAKLGPLLLDVVELGATLDGGDHYTPVIDSTIILDTPTTGHIEIDVTAMAKAAQMVGTEIHFRLRMATVNSGDIFADQIVLSSHDAGIDTTRPDIFYRVE